MTDSGLVYLKLLTKLQRLDLANTEVGSAGLESLSALKLAELRLDGTRGDDAGLAHLKSMTSLRQLVLSAGIGDKGLESVKPQTGLVRLDVGG